MAGIVFWACLWLAAVLKSTLATLRFQAQWHDDDYAWTNNSLELQHSCGSSPAIPCTGLALPASLAQTGVLNGSQICNSFTWIMVFVVFVLRAPVVAKLPVYLFLWGGNGGSVDYCGEEKWPYFQANDLYFGCCCGFLPLCGEQAEMKMWCMAQRWLAFKSLVLLSVADLKHFGFARSQLEFTARLHRLWWLFWLHIKKAPQYLIGFF